MTDEDDSSLFRQLVGEVEPLKQKAVAEKAGEH